MNSTDSTIYQQLTHNEPMKSISINWISKYAIFIIILLSIVSRMPQLFSEHLILDGDECIVGLMAKHFLESKEVPFFFYGQSYGFSFIEVLFIRVFYFFLGPTEMAVKLAMLSMWTIGVVFFYKTLKAIGFKHNAWIPLLITFLFIFSPSFAAWSMKARGGYMTSFLLSSIVSYLLLQEKSSIKLSRAVLIGFLLVIIYQSQALWLAGLAPFIAYHLYQKKSVRYGLTMGGGILVTAIGFYMIKLGLSDFWSPKVLGWPTLSVESFISILDKMYIHFTGFYYLGDTMTPNFITRLLSMVMMAAIFIAILVSAFFIYKKKQTNSLLPISLISVLFSLGYILLISWLGPRYFLPLTGFALILFSLVMDQIKRKTIVNTILGVWILMGVYSLYDFKNFAFEDKASLTQLVAKLEERKISHVFCEGALLQWQINFYSNEKTIARYTSNVDRYPKYIAAVDSAQIHSPNQTGIVGYYYEGLIKPSKDFSEINKRYYILSPVSKEFLEYRNFDLTRP